MTRTPVNAPYRDERGPGKPLIVGKAVAAEEQHAAVLDEDFIYCAFGYRKRHDLARSNLAICESSKLINIVVITPSVSLGGL